MVKKGLSLGGFNVLVAPKKDHFILYPRAESFGNTNHGAMNESLGKKLENKFHKLFPECALL